MATKSTKKSTSKRTRRTAEQRVAELEAEIARVREREATKALRADPAVKATNAAVRALNKALGEASEEGLVQALTQAKGLVAAYLEEKGLRVPSAGRKRQSAA